MPASDTHYDVIVIGSGPGGASVAHALAPTGKRIAILERGDYLPRERENWDAREVFVRGRYQVSDTWLDGQGNSFQPGLHRFVGGNSKVYGAILFRLRESDFGEVRHVDGVSPAWPISYADLEPWYDAAERLFHVHGARGEDPTEPPASNPYPYAAIRHEPRIQELAEGLTREGHHPFHLPVGVLLDQDDRGDALPHSPCIRCNRFDGYPCLTNGKADAQIMAVDPTLRDHTNVTLLTRTYAERLMTDARGGTITGVAVRQGIEGDDPETGISRTLTADIVVVACGALSSALLMLRSGSDAHPDGIANGSGLVGRRYIRHNNAVVLAISRQPNPTRFQKTLGLNDFYHAPDQGGMGDWEFPLGHIQMVGKSDGEQIEGEALPGALQGFTDKPFDWLARHSLDFWLTSEDLPRPENRIRYDGGRVRLDLTPTNMEAHRRLRAKLSDLVGRLDAHPHLMDRSLYFGQNVPVSGTAHQAGTMVFGTNPSTSVLDVDCRAHGIDNLYVADASFFPSIGAVNPTLTIIANALRVGDIIARRISV